MIPSTKLPCETGIVGRCCNIQRDQDLLVAIRTGPIAVFEKLQKLYSNRLYKRILSITRNHEDAEDALQDTFMRAFMALGSFQGRSHISTWLTKIAINSALIIIRRRRAHVEVSFTRSSESGGDAHEFDLPDSAPTPEEICDLKQRFDRMVGAIKRLDLKSRTAIGILVTQEYSMKEVAHTLDVSVAAVKERLHRARKKLSKHFGQKVLKLGTQQHRKVELNRSGAGIDVDKVSSYETILF